MSLGSFPTLESGEQPKTAKTNTEKQLKTAENMAKQLPTSALPSTHVLA
jgi:hypothetical protein